MLNIEYKQTVNVWSVGSGLRSVQVQSAVGGEGRVVEGDDQLVFRRLHAAGEHGVLDDGPHDSPLPTLASSQEQESGVQERESVSLPQPLVHGTQHNSERGEQPCY